MKRVFFIFLSLSIAVSSARASGPRCDYVFAENQSRVFVQQILAEHYDFDQSAIIPKLILKFSARQVSLEKNSPKQVREAIVKVDGLLRTLERLLSKDRSEDSAQLWGEREVLSLKLQDLAEKMGYPEPRTRGLIKKIFGSKLAKFVLNPGELPSVADKKIPEELVLKILNSGVEVNAKELNLHFASTGQSKVEAYRRVAVGYRVMAFILFSYLMFQQYEDFKTKLNANNSAQLNHSLDSLEEILSVLSEEIEIRGLGKNP